MKLNCLIESQEKKLGDMEIDGKIVAPDGVRRYKWDGNFWCDARSLTSLVGAPQYVVGDFMCNRNQLTSLEGAPQYVGGDFWCDYNQLTTLEGAPSRIGGNFWGDLNQLTSLKGCPHQVDGNFTCESNQLVSLEGAPSRIGGKCLLGLNQLTTLEGIHTQILEINEYADFRQNPIKSHVLGLLLIKGLKSVKFDNEQLEDVINKYLPLGDIMACQNELIDAGLEEFAQI